jgi:hypothetical protein
MQRGHDVLDAGVVGEQGAVLGVPVLLPGPDGVREIFAPGLLDGEVPVELHRRQHPIKIGLGVVLRDAFAPVGEHPGDLGRVHRRRLAGGDAVRGDRLLHRRDLPTRTPDGGDDLAVAMPGQRQRHDGLVLGHISLLK